MAQINDREAMLLIDKSFDTLMAETMEALKSTPISYSSKGGIAKTILAKVNQQLGTFYDTLKARHTEAFLSKATGDNIDAIGYMLNCSRLEGETDADYKYRIHNQTLSSAKANETAVRLAVLSVAGVQDVVLKEFTHGAGSFSAYLITDQTLNIPKITADVEAALKDVKALGIRASVFLPNISAVEFRSRLVFNPNVSEFDRTIIRNQATQVLRTYINTQRPGDTIQITEIRRQVMALSDQVLDMETYYFTIKGKAMLLVDQTSRWNERFREAEIPNAILIS